MDRIKLVLKIFSLQWIVLFVYSPVIAQDVANPNNEKVKIIADKVWNIDFISSIDFPQADLAKRFGTSYRIGVGIKHKSENNWLVGAKFEFITGNKMRDDSLLINLKTTLGGIITQSGQLYNVGMFQRGYMASVQLGKIFTFWQVNKNSGPMMLASVGFMQYKINLFDRDNSFPQLRGDYKKGYDRLTNGLFIEDFIGYQYLAKNKLVNFYAGLNAVYGFTQGRREYLYDLKRSDAGKRNDIMLGFKFGWVLPIYKKNTEETYY